MNIKKENDWGGGQGFRFTPYDVHESLYDQDRTNFFARAIQEVIKEGSVVVDAGSGSGVLGLLAAKYGASRVYCIEAQERFCNVIARNALANNLQDRIIVVNADATTYTLPEKVDVIIAEVISGGFFFEPQIQIINNLRSFLNDGGKIIPNKINTYVEVVSAQEELYGLKFAYDSRCMALEDIVLTEKEIALESDFYQYVSPDISLEIILTGTKDAIANAIKVPYSAELTPNVIIQKPTSFLLRPEIIYLPEKIEIRKGKRYILKMQYRAGSDTLDAKISLSSRD